MNNIINMINFEFINLVLTITKVVFWLLITGYTIVKLFEFAKDWEEGTLEECGLRALRHIGWILVFCVLVAMPIHGCKSSMKEPAMVQASALTLEKQ